MPFKNCFFACILPFFACNTSSPQQATAPVVDCVQPEVNVSAQDTLNQANAESMLASGDDITKAFVSLSDSTIYLSANIRRDHRMFGYSEANLRATKLILFSVFTNDVEGNPFHCSLGAYYDTNGLKGSKLQFVEQKNGFVKARFVKTGEPNTTIFFEGRFVEIQN